MKFVLFAVMLAVQTQAAPPAAKPIWVIDSAEFAFIEHKTGKERYAARLIKLLKELKIKEQGFDTETADWHELIAIMSAPSQYDPIVARIDALCAEKKNRSVCLRMEKLRGDSLQWNKDNPESFED